MYIQTVNTQSLLNQTSCIGIVKCMFFFFHLLDLRQCAYFYYKFNIILNEKKTFYPLIQNEHQQLNNPDESQGVELASP